jgi:hypothetical protein
MERITPGAMNSVKVGVFDPYTGASNWIGRLVVLLSKNKFDNEDCSKALNVKAIIQSTTIM